MIIYLKLNFDKPKHFQFKNEDKKWICLKGYARKQRKEEPSLVPEEQLQQMCLYAFVFYPLLETSVHDEHQLHNVTSEMLRYLVQKLQHYVCLLQSTVN